MNDHIDAFISQIIFEIDVSWARAGSVSGFSKISKEIGTLLMSSEVLATVCLHRISAILSPD